MGQQRTNASQNTFAGHGAHNAALSNTYQTKSKNGTNAGFFQSTGMVANNAQLGRLPTLGLGKIRAEDFIDDKANPFKIQENTEKLLVMRELEREFKDLNRYEKES